MMIQRFRGHAERVAAELRRSFSDEYSPNQIAGSFSIGVFITMLPTLGTGLLLFFVLAYVFDWINKIALFAAVLVFNPVVKWGVYAGSVALGVFLLGPIEGGPGSGAGQAVLIRLLVGNLVLAAVATVVAYALVYRLARRYQDTVQEMVEVVIEEVIDDYDEEVSA